MFLGHKNEVFIALRGPKILFLTPQALLYLWTHELCGDILLTFLYFMYGFGQFFPKKPQNHCLILKVLEVWLPKNQVSRGKIRVRSPKKHLGPLRLIKTSFLCPKNNKKLIFSKNWTSLIWLSTVKDSHSTLLQGPIGRFLGQFIKLKICFQPGV